MKGGIWFPTSFVLVEALLKFSAALGPKYAVSIPASGQPVTPREIAEEIAGAHDPSFPPGWRQRTSHLSRHEEIPARPVLARLSAVQRVLSRRNRSRAGGESPDRLEGPDCQPDSGVAHLDRVIASSGDRCGIAEQQGVRPQRRAWPCKFSRG